MVVPAARIASEDRQSCGAMLPANDNRDRIAPRPAARPPFTKPSHGAATMTRWTAAGRARVSTSPSSLMFRLTVTKAGYERLGRRIPDATVRTETRESIESSRVYWDTPEGLVARHGLALYMTKSAGTAEQALVRIDDHRPLRRAASNGSQPSLEALGSPGKRLLRELAGNAESLIPVFDVFMSGTARTIRFREDGRARLLLATQRLTAGTMPPAEQCFVEVVNEDADPRRCWELAFAISKHVKGCGVDFATHATRGQDMRGHGTTPRHARPAKIPRGANAQDLAVAALRESLDHLERNIAGAHRPDYEESVHQMRVSLRRLQVAGRIGAAAGVPTFSRSFEAELRWARGILGDIRDWHILATHLAAALPPDAASEHVAPMLSQGRDEHRRRLVRFLGSARFQRLVIVAEWVLAHQRQAGTTRSARSASRKLLARAWRRLISHGRSLAALTPLERHAVRIDTKKLRYLAEFAQPLYGKRASGGFVERVARLQSTLGELNDVDVASRHVEPLLALPGSEGWLEPWGHHVAERCSMLEPQLERQWRKVLRADPFWEKR